MGRYLWPCPDYTRVSSRFGMRMHPIQHVKKQHSGIDLACVSGKAILAARPGMVERAEWNGSYGNYVLLDHGEGIKTRYAHASKLLVSKGDAVAVGTEIARVGATGDTTGPHLHFEMILNGTPVDPEKYVSPQDTLAQYTGSNSTALAGAADASSAKQGESKEITDVVIQSTVGSAGAARSTDLLREGEFQQNGCELILQNDRYYYPNIEGEITWETSLQGSPGKLTFHVLKDDIINFQEGNPVRFRAKGQEVFYGFVFSKSRGDSHLIEVTAYDQLRYFKNKDTIIYKNKKYSEVLRMVAEDYGLACGEIEDTGYVIPARVEEDTLFDILGNASDLTLLNTRKKYILFDSFGKLCLKNLESLIVPVLIDGDTAGSYSYTSTIDDSTYNRIKLAYDNQDTGRREIWMAQDGENQSRWGILQHYETIDPSKVSNPVEMADRLLEYYNAKTRSLSISQAFGDLRVRGGSSVAVNLNLGDVEVCNLMAVETAKHTFSNGEHFMDLTVKGIKGREFIV